MSGIPVSQTLWITPLSPVHMGTDEDYVPTNYVIDGDALFEFDFTALSRLPEEDRKVLDRILSGHPRREMIRQVQGFFHQRRERLIPHAVNVVRVCRGVADLYGKRVGKAANVEAGGREVYHLLEIERAAYNPSDRRLMFQGSGLKGAIRTALLDEHKGSRTLKELLFYDKRSKQERPPKNNQEMQESIFEGTFSTDPMRLIQVSDAHWCGAEKLNSAEVLFAVNRKKHPGKKNGGLSMSQAEQKGLHQLLECTATLCFRAFRLTLSVVDISAAGNHSGTPKKRFTLDDIAAACNNFYQPILERELAQMQKRGFLDGEWLQIVQGLLLDPDLQTRLNANQAFLLRVGRHSGAESVTLNGVRKIKIMTGRGGSPKWAAEASTWWLAAREKDDQHHLIPFGWLLVEIGEVPPSWPRAQELIGAHLAEQVAWRKHSLERQQRYKEQYEAVRRLAEQKAEAKARADAEQKKKLVEATAGLPEDAAEIERHRLEPTWKDNNVFLDFTEKLLDDGSPSAEAMQRLKEELERRWKGILTNPDAVHGKKKKPKFKARPRELAKQLLALEARS